MKNKKALLIAFITLFATTFMVSCKKDKKEAPVVTISPEQLQIAGNVNDVINFRINVITNSQLSKVIIKAQPDNAIPFTLLDTVITTKGTSFNYYFKLPATYAGQSLALTFRAEDQNGLTGEAFRRVFIAALPAVHPVALTETSGHRMFRFRSTHFDSYNLETNSGEYTLTADSTSRDIQDFTDTSNVTLSKNWKSPAGGKFVLYNSGSGFDYANATDSTTIGAYTSGLKTSLLYNLQIGDVIITKLGSMSTNKYVVMRLTDIVDAVGKNDDYYEFTIKK